MTDWLTFMNQQRTEGAAPAAQGCVGCFGNLETEYHSLDTGPALVDRSDRGLLEITGKDRATWLHNLATNEVKNLTPGEGNYAFAVNVKGRILFDLNILLRADSIWVDLDRRVVGTAQAHFAKYIVIEDVSLTDRSDDFVRMALVGDKAKTLLARMGTAHAAAISSLGTTKIAWNDGPMLMLRHDFCGPFAVELFVPAGQAVTLWRSLADPSGEFRAIPVGHDAVEIRRIEAGLPWPPWEINDEYLPAETMQLERAVSRNKGCYLGQEVVERMRSRGALARRLIGLQFEGDLIPPSGAVLTINDGQTVGTVTSACRSISKHAPIGLGYGKTAAAAAGNRIRAEWDDQSVDAIVVEPPWVAQA